jgi:hypothetical protein
MRKTKPVDSMKSISKIEEVREDVFFPSREVEEESSPEPLAVDDYIQIQLCMWKDCDNSASRFLKKGLALCGYHYTEMLSNNNNIMVNPEIEE